MNFIDNMSLQISVITETLESVLLWNLQIIQEKGLIDSQALPKLRTIIDIALKSDHYKNKVIATSILANLFESFEQDQQLRQYLSCETLSFLIRQLSATTNEPNQVDLYKNTLKAICTLLSSDSDFYIRQIIDEDILDRLHAIILTERPDEIKEALWGLSNIACHDDRMANILVQDDIFDSILSLLKSTKIQLRKEASLTFSQLMTTLPYEKLLELLQSENPPHKTMLADYLKNLLLISDKAIVMDILNTIEYLLNVDEQAGLYHTHCFKYYLEINQCFDHLERLQQSGETYIYQKIENIISTYLPIDNDEDVQEHQE